VSDAAARAPDLTAEGSGETVGEAKWAALRELERRYPSLDRSRVEFTVLSEGERGLLGVGFVEARVIARLPEVAELAPVPPDDEEPADDEVAALRDLLDRICSGIGVPARARVRRDGETLSAVIQGGDLGLLIGKRGHTIDAIQYLATAVLARTLGHRVDVSVDAAGYRERRRRTLESLADRTADRVVASGRAAELEAMSAPERKVVHLRLHDRDDVQTASEGEEPNRYVIVRPSDG
jgi:spoIIIJ-associated protein